MELLEVYDIYVYNDFARKCRGVSQESIQQIHRYPW